MIVSVTNEHGTTSLPACCISKSLPDHLKSRGLTINELCSITVTILGCSAILYGIPFHVYTDNLALVFLMGKRFSAEVAAHNPIVQRLLLSVCSFSFIVSYCPGDLQVADYLSRIKTELGQPVDEFLSKTSKLEDYDKVADLLRPGRDKESEDAFIKNIKLIRKLESEMGDTRRELYSYFRSTHYSLHDMMPTKLTQKPTTNHIDHSSKLPVTRGECEDVSFLDGLTTGEDEAAEWAKVNELLLGVPFFQRRFREIESDDLETHEGLIEGCVDVDHDVERKKVGEREIIDETVSEVNESAHRRAWSEGEGESESGDDEVKERGRRVRWADEMEAKGKQD